MLRISQFAAPAVLGAAVAFGLGGCASDRPHDVPSSATVISEGKETVVTTAPHDGTVYVYDDTAHKMVYSGRVDKGDNVRVDAKHNKIYFNDRLASERDLVNDHRFEVYFDRVEGPDAATAAHREGATIIAPAPAAPSGTYTAPSGTYTAPSGGATVVQPPSGGATVVQPNNGGATVVAPNSGGATVVQPNSNGATIVTPNGSTTVEHR